MAMAIVMESGTNKRDMGMKNNVQMVVEGSLKLLALSVAKEIAVKTPMGVTFLEQLLLNAQLFDRKQQDYGSGNIAVFGEKGVIVRSSDKIQRLKHMVFDGNGDSTVNEAIVDSWQDLANYGVIGHLCHEGKWK